MGGPYGISGFSNGDKKIGNTTVSDLKKVKEFADKKLAYEMSMKGSIMMERLAQLQAMQGGGVYGGNTVDGGLKSFGNLAKEGIELIKNLKSNNTKSASQSDGVSNASARQTQGNVANVVINDGSAYSGYAKGVNAANFSYDTDCLQRIEQQLCSDSEISSADLAAMQEQLSTSKADVSQQLTDAKTNLSNLEGQKQTAESQVTELQGAVGEAQTAKTDAKKNLDNNKSNLNQSVKARDQLDDQLSAVNDDYKEKCNTVKQEESAKSSAQQEVSSAKTEVAQAKSGLAMANQQLASAETTLANTPQTIDGKPNPAYASAKAAVEAAEAQKEQAEQKLDAAEQSLDTAETKLQEAEERLNNAQQAKAQTLQTLQQTDSKYKDMAKRCEQMEKSVENSQKNYDTSLETFDNTNSNYERLNTELQSQQGILNQLEFYQSEVYKLELASSQVSDLETALNHQLEAQNNQSDIDFEQVQKDLIANANKSEGCGANKTIIENLIASKDYDLSQCKGELWNAQTNVAYGSAAKFEAQGYIKNSDGSFTDPRSGVTMMNVLGDDNTWVSQRFFASAGEVPEFGSKAAAGRDFPGLFEAIDRNQEQINSHINIDGFDSEGNPKFRREKYSLENA